MGMSILFGKLESSPVSPSKETLVPEVEGRLTCQCGAAIAHGASYCIECGKPISYTGKTRIL